MTFHSERQILGGLVWEAELGGCEKAQDGGRAVSRASQGSTHGLSRPVSSTPEGLVARELRRPTSACILQGVWRAAQAATQCWKRKWGEAEGVTACARRKGGQQLPTATNYFKLSQKTLRKQLKNTLKKQHKAVLQSKQEDKSVRGKSLP